MSSTTEPLSIKQPLHQEPFARQFVKFLIVGFSSTVVNIGVSNVMQYGLHYPLLPSVTIGFLLSCINGFFWNRRWTFRHARGHSAATQSLRFVLVNSVGLLLNTSIIVLMLALYQTAKGANTITWPHLVGMFALVVNSKGKHAFPQVIFNAASITATGFVVFWNYFANRMWTFRHKDDA